MDGSFRAWMQLVISLIVPNYNPGLELRDSWLALREFVHVQKQPWEVLFVCDGSNNGSIEQLQQWSQQERTPWCRVLSYSPNQGKGFAVRAGLQAARGSIRVFTDVDLAYSFADLLQVVQAVQRGSPVAIASREHPESQALVPMSMVGYVYWRRVQSHLFRSVARLIVGLSHVDTQAGLKAFSNQASETILPVLQCQGFGFDCELLLACKRMELAVQEIPVTVRYQTTTSTTSWKTSFQMLKQMWQIRRRWKRGIPAPTPMPVTVNEFSWQPQSQPAQAA